MSRQPHLEDRKGIYSIQFYTAHRHITEASGRKMSAFPLQFFFFSTQIALVPATQTCLAFILHAQNQLP